MDTKLFNAILSMDSYNRGYNPTIKFGNLGNGESLTIGEKIGRATITTDSRILVDGSNNRVDQAASFYAIAYEMPNDATWGGKTIISYRGTDSVVEI